MNAEKAKEVHDALVVCYNATPNESLREWIALIEVMILESDAVSTEQH